MASNGEETSMAWRLSERSLGAIISGLCVGGMLYGVASFAQAPTTAQPPTPRAPDGKPDLTGIWIPGARGGGASRYDEQGGETVFAAREGSFENFEND